MKIEAQVGYQRTCTKRVWGMWARKYWYTQGSAPLFGLCTSLFLRDAVPCAWEQLHLCHWKGGGVLVESISELCE